MAGKYTKSKKKSTKTTSTTISSVSGGTKSVSSSGSVGSGGGRTDDPNAGSSGSANLNFRPSRHFYVVPTSADFRLEHAATTVIAPYKTYLGQLGPYVGAGGKVSDDVDNKFYVGAQGFAEVVGVVPTKLTIGREETTGAKLLQDHIEAIKYNYLSNGHKTISIIYPKSSSKDIRERIIQFNVLFSDGSVITVKQPVVSNTLVSGNGIVAEIDTGGLHQNPVFRNLRNNGGISFKIGAPAGRGTVTSFISAGSWIRGNFKGGDNLTPKKHLWWKVTGRREGGVGKIGAVFHQQAYESYGTAGGSNSVNGITYGLEPTVRFNWKSRYGLADRNSFAVKTGADSFEGSAANELVGSSLYPRGYSKYTIAGNLTSNNARLPRWQSVNKLGAINYEENSDAYSQYPTNRFGPVNSHYNGGVGHTIQQDGLCISFKLLTNEADASSFQPRNLNRAHESLALSLRGFLKGLTESVYISDGDGDGGYGGGDGGGHGGGDDHPDGPDGGGGHGGGGGNGDDGDNGGGGPSYPDHGGFGVEDDFGLGKRISGLNTGSVEIPSSDPFNITANYYNNNLSAGEICMKTPEAGDTHISIGQGPADTIANLITGNRNLFFTPVTGGSNLKQRAVFAAAMGRSVGEYSLSTSQWYADEVFVNDETSGSSADTIGVILPFMGTNIRQGFRTGERGDLAPDPQSPNYRGNVVMQAIPFFNYIDFPVIENVYEHVDKTGRQSRIKDEITEFPAAQGVPDYVSNSTYTKSGATSATRAINKLPVELNTSIFPSTFNGFKAPAYVNVDPNTTYTIDNKHAPGNMSSGNLPTIGFDRETRQPWGRLNIDYGSSLYSNYLISGYLQDTFAYAAGKLSNCMVFYNTSIELNYAENRSLSPKLKFTQKLDLSVESLLQAVPINGFIQNAFELPQDLFSLQFQTNLSSGATTVNSEPQIDSDSNIYDIYDWKYTPGRFLADNALFPINTDDIASESDITFYRKLDISDYAYLLNASESTAQTTTIILDEEAPDNARPFVDIDVEDIPSEGWNNINSNNLQFNAASQIVISKTTQPIGHIGNILTGADTQNLIWSREYNFVVPGLTDYEGGFDTDEVRGCMDADAQNFNAEATISDGSCIYCKPKNSDIVNPHLYIQNGISGVIPNQAAAGQFILDAPKMGNGSSYGLGGYVTNSSWAIGNIGNAVNYADPTLGIAINNPATAAPFTSMQFEANVSLTGIINAAQSAGSTVNTEAWAEYWIENLPPESFSLIIYPIDAFDEDHFNWGTTNTLATYTQLPILEGYSSVITLENQGDSQQIKFGTDYPSDIGNVSLGLEPGQHYLAVLQIQPVGCNSNFYLAYNFWVLYCDCNLEDANNFGGNNWNYPWSNVSAFPGGWGGTHKFCFENPTSSKGWRRTKKGANDEEDPGLCELPEEYTDCSQFIDWCVVSDTFDCELTGNVASGFQNIGTGTLSINVYGVYTGSEAEYSEYALYVNGQLFEFKIELLDINTGIIIDTIIVDDLDDYLTLSGGISPQNMQFVQVLFEDIPEGNYYVHLTQLGALFPMQDPDGALCTYVHPSAGSNEVTIGGDEPCDNDIICDCNDPAAYNYNPNATTVVNGVPFDECNDQCLYEDCSEIFSQVLITDVITTNSTAECAEIEIDTDSDGVNDTTSYYLADTASGTASFGVSNFDASQTVGNNLVTNGNFSATSTTKILDGNFPSPNVNWILHSSTINGGSATITGLGSLTSTGNNWSVSQNVIDIGVRSYKVTFTAKQLTGTGAMYGGIGYNNIFNQVVTGEFVTYTFHQHNVVTEGNGTRVAFGGVLATGGETANTFEIKDVVVQELGEDWTFGTAWSITLDDSLGSRASVDSTETRLLSQSTINLVAGTFYKITCEVSSYAAGALQIQFGGLQVLGSTTSDGVFTVFGTPDTNGLPLYLYGVAIDGDVDFSVDNVSVKEIEVTDFNIGIVSLLNGDQSTGTQTLFQYYSNNSEAIISAAPGTASIITQNGVTVGAFLSLNQTTIPSGVFSANNLYAGNFLAFAIPVSTAVSPETNNIETCENELLEILDNFATFQILLDTSSIPDGSCPEGCNEVTNPEDCDDYVAGCTDESASNYNPLATYDSGDCEYGGAEDCVTTPSLPECEECEGTSDAPGGGLRMCDEVNGNEAGCMDPLACNYNANAVIAMPFLCEYCCDGDDDCVETGEDDECQDELGNIDPDCVTSECPDPTNPNCGQPPINPCPNPGDCPPPPVPDCIQLGTCGDDDDSTDDPNVIIDDVSVDVISCDPLFNGLEFSQWQETAMTCSAEKGTQMLFKLRSGVKQSKTDMIKLVLINYLFNQGLDLPCLYSCDAETKTLRNRNVVKDCLRNWALSGSQNWTPKSTYLKGETVRVLKNVRGQTKASYYIAKQNIPAQQVRPDTKIPNNSFWELCRTRKPQESSVKGANYLQTLYEFMIKHCENCSIRPRGTETYQGNDNVKSIQSGLSDADDNEIIF